MAGSIDNLNFEIILNDADFSQRVARNIQLAKDLNTSLSSLLDLQSKVRQFTPTGNHNKDARDAQKLAAETAKAAVQEEKLAAAQLKTQEAAERLATATANRAAAETRAANATRGSASAHRSMVGAINSANRAYAQQSRLLRDLRMLSWQYFSIYGIGRMVSSLVRITGEFELQRTTLGAIIGDLNQAEGILSQIKQLAVQSPFQFKELATYAKQLSAFSVPAEELFETTKMLADVSAGLGVGMDRLVLAYGQVKSAAFLRGQEVRQFTEAGIPILAELAKQFTELEGRAVSTGEVFEKISARLVPFEMVSKMFKDMTSEGGKFYKMQEVQAETLRGKVSNLKDAFEIMMNEIGESKSGFLKDTVDLLRSMMENWEKIAVVLKTVIAVYGTYKAVLAAVWMYEKLMVAGRSIKYFFLLTQRVSTATAAMRAFGVSTQMAIAGIVGSIMGVAALISSLVDNAYKLRRELDQIRVSELGSANNLVSGLDSLLDRLKEATQGTQTYRDIISEINRTYGEYLPQVYSEANAYEEVAAAAEKARIAIMNKAKASALEKGYREIEEEYGSGYLDKSIELEKSIKRLLVSYGGFQISEKDLSDFIKVLRTKLEDAELGSDLWEEVFIPTSNKFFGTNKVEQALLKVQKDHGIEERNEVAEDTNTAVTDFLEAYQEYVKAKKDFDRSVDNAFASATYSSLKEAQKLEKINADYAKALNDKDNGLKNQTLTLEEYNNEVEKLDIEKLQKLVNLYTNEINMPKKAKEYQAQLDALTKFADGWQGIVQRLLKEDLKLTKNSSFGLWADTTTLSTDYLDDLVKRYKELKEDIKNISSFDPSYAQRLTKNKEVIEAIAKVLNIDLAALTKGKGGQKESPEEKRLKRLIGALRDLQKQYEKLKSLGVEDFDIRNFFKNTYPELVSEEGEDFVTNFNYLERALELIDQLEKYDAEEAKRLRVELGGDKFSIWVKALEAQNKAYKEAADAAEDYFKTLREWGTQDFNIDGSGIIFDINKIASDLNTATNKIELKALKLRETFQKILPTDFGTKVQNAITAKVSSESLANNAKNAISQLDSTDIQKINDALTKELGGDMAEQIITSAIPALKTIQAEIVGEFGQDAWSEFWNKFKKEGISAISVLSEKEAEYEKKKAQEKLNDLAKKYVSESTSDLSMTDWGDKTLSQITDIQNAIKNLLDGGFVVDESTLDNLKEAGLTIDDLKNKVQELLTGKYNETITEKIKAIQNVTKKALSIFGTLGTSFQNMSEGFGSEGLATAGEYLSVVGEITDAIADCDALWDTIGESAKIAADAASEVGKAAGSLAASLSWITMVIKVVLIVVEQIANAFGRASQKQRELNLAALEYNKIINERRLDAADTMFGENFRKKIDSNIKAVNDAKNAFLEYAEKLKAADFKDVWAIVEPDKVKKMTHAFQFANKLGYDLYDDATSSINFEELEKFAKDYEANKKLYENATKNKDGYKLSADLKKELEDLEVFFKAYEEALAKLKETTKEIFGDLADTIASNMIDAFKSTGDAAADLGKVFEGLGETLLQSLLSTWVLDNILTKYEDQATKILESMAKGEDEFTIGNMLGDLVDGIKKDVEYGSSFAQQLIELFQERGLLGVEDGGAETLADGIKGITEDTANLLASYLNAIRADVAYSKTLWERMDQSTQAIASALIGFSAPSLMEYQAQIAANTYNTAMHTQEIMLGLRSVITAEGGLSAIRILQY